ncbi:hypothetical protein EDD86DRAFT_215187 [Gorgonomyces haynaldii]|nr:hypothetical protein EDD86DRAFT_215187 [Gorgonomyces haynaldii]
MQDPERQLQEQVVKFTSHNATERNTMIQTMYTQDAQLHHIYAQGKGIRQIEAMLDWWTWFTYLSHLNVQECHVFTLGDDKKRCFVITNQDIIPRFVPFRPKHKPIVVLQVEAILDLRKEQNLYKIQYQRDFFSDSPFLLLLVAHIYCIFYRPFLLLVFRDVDDPKIVKRVHDWIAHSMAVIVQLFDSRFC